VGVPEAVIVKLKAVPTVPAAVSGELVMIGDTPAAATVIVRGAATLVPVAFVAVSEALMTPATRGVPVITPVVVLRTREAGRPAAAKLRSGAPVAVML